MVEDDEGGGVVEGGTVVVVGGIVVCAGPVGLAAEEGVLIAAAAAWPPHVASPAPKPAWYDSPFDSASRATIASAARIQDRLLSIFMFILGFGCVLVISSVGFQESLSLSPELTTLSCPSPMFGGGGLFCQCFFAGQ